MPFEIVADPIAAGQRAMERQRILALIHKEGRPMARWVIKYADEVRHLPRDLVEALIDELEADGEIERVAISDCGVKFVGYMPKRDAWPG